MQRHFYNLFYIFSNSLKKIAAYRGTFSYITRTRKSKSSGWAEKSPHISKDTRFQNINVSKKPPTIIGHFATANTRVLEKKFKTLSKYIEHLHTCLWGYVAKLFQKVSYYNWKLQREKLMVYAKFFLQKASLYYNGKVSAQNLMVYTNFFSQKISSHYKLIFEYRLAGCFRKK